MPEYRDSAEDGLEVIIIALDLIRQAWEEPNPFSTDYQCLSCLRQEYQEKLKNGYSEHHRR